MSVIQERAAKETVTLEFPKYGRHKGRLGLFRSFKENNHDVNLAWTPGNFPDLPATVTLRFDMGEEMELHATQESAEESRLMTLELPVDALVQDIFSYKEAESILGICICARIEDAEVRYRALQYIVTPNFH